MTEQGQMIIDKIIENFKTGDDIGYSILQRKYSIGYSLANKVILELKNMGHLKDTEFSHLGMWTFNAL